MATDETQKNDRQPELGMAIQGQENVPAKDGTGSRESSGTRAMTPAILLLALTPFLLFLVLWVVDRLLR